MAQASEAGTAGKPPRNPREDRDPLTIVEGNPNELGLGDIVISALDLKTFRRFHGDDGQTSSWVICDGSSVSNSRYSLLTGLQTVPDMRGYYPRGSDITIDGQDLGRIPVALSAKALGATILQQDTIDHPHTHNFDHNHQLIDSSNGGHPYGRMGDARGGGDNEVPRYPTYGGPVMTTGGPSPNYTGPMNEQAPFAGKEVRPKTFIVNFYIRIN